MSDVRHPLTGRPAVHPHEGDTYRLAATGMRVLVVAVSDDAAECRYVTRNGTVDEEITLAADFLRAHGRIEYRRRPRSATSRA